MSVQVVKFGGWSAWAIAHLAFSLVAIVPAVVCGEVAAQEAESVPQSTAKPAATEPAASESATFEGNPLKYQTTSSSPESANPAPNLPSAATSSNGKSEVPLADPAKILIGGDFVIPPGRPDWIAKFSEVQFGEANGQSPGKQVAICSGPFTTEAEARLELNNKAREVADRYIESTLGSPQASLLLGYSGEQIKSRFVKRQNEYVETVTFSFGPMKQVHALVQFTPDFDGELQHRWRQIRSASRVGVVALVGAVALGMLFTFFGYLRADTSTRGYYTTRLKFAAGGAILAIVVAGFMASRWVHWL